MGMQHSYFWLASMAWDRLTLKYTKKCESFPVGSLCAVLPSDRRSSLFFHHIFLPSLYLLRCVYLTHSSRRGSKLALNNNRTDNYSQGTTQKTKWNKMDHWPFFLSCSSFSPSIHLLFPLRLLPLYLWLYHIFG